MTYQRLNKMGRLVFNTGNLEQVKEGVPKEHIIIVVIFINIAIAAYTLMMLCPMTCQRLNKMGRLVFNTGNLEQLKEGVVLLMDCFLDMVSVPFEHGNCFAHTDLMARLETVEQKKWRPIRNIFLLDPFYGYVQGDFSQEENVSPAKIVLDFISVLNHLHQDLVAKLEGYQHIVNKLNKEKRELENQLSRLEQKVSEHRMSSTHDRTEMKTARSSIQFLEKAVKEKNEKIAELQREKNVQLWEREKEKALADVKNRMDFLENKNAELVKQNESLQKKFALADEQHKRLKMKTELMAGEIPPIPNKSEEELKRQLYLQEKDLIAMESELLSQQKIFSTVLCGIKTDLFIVGETLTDPDSGQIPLKDFVRLTGMVERLATAMANGDIETARGSLPPHYTYLPSDFKVKRIRRVSNLNRDRLPPILKPELKDATHANGNPMTPEKTEYFIESVVENPQLVNPEDNVVNFVNCMKHFPHLSVDFIKDHWAKFKEFDANGDTSLDFSEVVRALTAMGLQFTAQQAEEAMREADVNQNRSLDFYEYILVADKLIHRTGRSELFRTNPRDRKVLSKTCVLQ
ncbi:uncharacterized protein LOC143289313 [Babylonia areolata]|uniref:uncharacterized protein LOC143289313 n=1 Tax=Babylonia areolata TaxID=304850 RepID=UPI003FD2F16A